MKCKITKILRELPEPYRPKKQNFKNQKPEIFYEMQNHKKIPRKLPRTNIP